MLVEVVSTTENYFRDILSRLLQICPDSKTKSSEKTISLGSVMWHGGQNFERGAFENLSFSDSSNIKKACSEFLGYPIKEMKNGGQTMAVMEEFNKICELRHGIVHSNSVLAGKNAVKLGIGNKTNLTKIRIEFSQFQQCAAICSALVISFNTELFEEMARRWAVIWPKKYQFDNQQLNDLFKKIWISFFSQIDSEDNTIAVPMTMVKCRNRIKTFYHV